MIKIANSFGIGGYYMVMPQDLPPIMQAIACYKICWEMSENISPYDYQQPEQLQKKTGYLNYYEGLKKGTPVILKDIR